MLALKIREFRKGKLWEFCVLLDANAVVPAPQKAPARAWWAALFHVAVLLSEIKKTKTEAIRWGGEGNEVCLGC